MADFDKALHSHIAQAMSGAADANMNIDIIRQAPFITLASSAADARIDAKWPSAAIDASETDDVDALQLYDSVFGAFDTDGHSSTAPALRVSEVPSARSLFADEENEDVHVPRNLDEDADTHHDAADEDCLVRNHRSGYNDGSDDDAEVHNTNENADNDDDSDGGGRYVFSSSDDSEIYLDSHGDEEHRGADRTRIDVDADDDIDDEEPFDRRGFERERGGGAASAVKKKHRRKETSDDAPLRKGGESTKAKRKRDTNDVDEQTRLRKIQAQRKIDLKTKMASAEQKATVQQYLLTCAIEYTRLVRHAETPLEPYKKYRTLVLEAAQDEECEKEVRDMANAVLETDAENMETVSCATNANPEPMRAMCDFVANAVLVKELAECPATAARCDITQRAAERSELVCMEATGADGQRKTVVLRSSLRNLLLHVWTLTNLYDLTVCMVQEWVKKAARKEPQWSIRDTITRAPADEHLQARLLKKIAEAHAMVNWSSAAFAKK